MNHNVIDLSNTQVALRQLRNNIRKEGLSWERDRDTLEATFGRHEESLNEETEGAVEPRNTNPFVRKYREAAQSSRDDAEALDQEAKAILADIEGLLQYIDPIRRRWFDEEELQRYQSRAAALIPKPDVAEKLLRYQVTLERSIERTLTQLERLQRMRLGQPVAPPIKVQIAG